MTVYAVMECDKMVELYRSPANACNRAKHLADKKEEELGKTYGDDGGYEVWRKDNKVVLDDIYENYPEVWNYWVKSVDVLNKFEG